MRNNDIGYSSLTMKDIIINLKHVFDGGVGSDERHNTGLLLKYYEWHIG